MTNEAPLSILLVDDDVIDRQVVRRAFHKLGESPIIIEAVDSRTAYLQLDGRSFDCILLDYRLPDADGLTIVRTLRGNGLTTPIIVLTGQGDERTAVELMKAGATDYLVKKVMTAEHLSHSVRSAIRIQQAEIRAIQMREESLSRLQFLSEIGRALSSSLDISTLIERILKLLIPKMADWCALDLLDVDGSFYRNVGCLPEQNGWAADVAACWPLADHESVGVAAVVRSQTALVYPPSYTENAPFNLEYLSRRLELSAVSAALCHPISSGEHIFGGLTLVRRAPGTGYSLPEIALVSQINERIGAAFENARLLQLAHEAIRLRDDFLSIASHELRTPLTSMLGYVQLLERNLRRKHSLDERENRAIATIVEQTMRLKKLISSMLDVSRLQNGQLSLEPEPLDLRLIVQEIVAELHPTLSTHRLTLTDVDGVLPVVGDKVRLQQVLLNLLNNAMKYSPQGGAIQVLLNRQPGWASIAISDQGIGIPPESQNYLFNRFFRATNANERRISGIGLGLYVVHQIVVLHGGAISVDSQVGQGSTFTVRLPLAE